MRFIINKPSVWMYKTDNLCGEVSDELLYGTVLEIISENDTCVYCRTDYGYSGYINKWEICECETEDCSAGLRRLLFQRCDVLSTPEYRYIPVMSLPKGAYVITEGEYDSRFSICLVGKKKYYVPNYALKKEYDGNFFDAFVKMAESYIGQQKEVLFELCEDGRAVGHTPEFLEVAVITTDDLHNCVKTVKLNGFDGSVYTGFII